jgi:hypothetical protein
VLDLYDRTNPGPHDDVSAIDVLALNALNAFRKAPMTPMTSLWVNRGSIAETASAITSTDYARLSDAELESELPKVSAALGTIRSCEGVGDVGAAKLLHRLRPNIVPVYDNRIWHSWYADTRLDPSWKTWLRRVYSEVRTPQNRECLARLQGSLDVPLPTLRIWDIILWQRSLNRNTVTGGWSSSTRRPAALSSDSERDGISKG